MASKNFTRSQRVGFQSPSQAQTNVQARLKWLNATGMSLEVQVLGQAVTTLVHTWADKAGGVDLLSEFWVGNPSYGPAFNRWVGVCSSSHACIPMRHPSLPGPYLDGAGRQSPAWCLG